MVFGRIGTPDPTDPMALDWSGAFVVSALAFDNDPTVAVASDGADFLVVFDYLAGAAGNVMGQMIDSAGNPVLTDVTTNFEISTASRSQSRVALTWAGDRYRAAWADERHRAYAGIRVIYGQDIAPDGTLMGASAAQNEVQVAQALGAQGRVEDLGIAATPSHWLTLFEYVPGDEDYLSIYGAAWER
jgi:hypothetical protein